MNEINEILVHPYAAAMPLMSEADYHSLVQSIQMHGQQQPIVLLDGMLLDGRARYRACAKLGLVPQYSHYAGGDPVGFLVEKNLKARGLGVNQLAMIAARILSALPPGIKVREVAGMFGVCHTSVYRARNVLSGGTVEEINLADAGRLSVQVTGRQIGAGVAPEDRAADRKTKADPKPSRSKKINSAFEAGLWADLTKAMTLLTGLPLAADMARIVRNNPKRTVATNERLARAHQWLENFKNAWDCRNDEARGSARNGAGDGVEHGPGRSGDDQPGDRDQVAGAEPRQPARHRRAG